ncbi:hypothetical protein NPIL_198831 [Nephila pilipes]|uniref:Uncharacterized protein n=1 Tax=Nephila pilipes TaxID=299642 RepID=A0A8X6QFN8_NEPPI|nr:hypothetical protein NPIL_643141 [Nephila pilipes]GFU24224.1 hypothetical protein NPIL_198831 [Nephila pilipes]
MKSVIVAKLLFCDRNRSLYIAHSLSVPECLFAPELRDKDERRKISRTINGVYYFPFFCSIAGGKGPSGFYFHFNVGASKGEMTSTVFSKVEHILEFNILGETRRCYGCVNV